MEQEKKISATATSFKIPADLKKRFKIVCAERGVDQTTVVLAAIRHFVEAKGLDNEWHDALTELLATPEREIVTEFLGDRTKKLRMAADVAKSKRRPAPEGAVLARSRS